MALTGGNGTGKTTLIQMILNHEEGISISPKAKIGYFAQNGYKYNSNQMSWSLCRRIVITIYQKFVQC